MLTIHCDDVKAIRHELAVYVSDQIGAVPTLKTSEFVLSPVEDEPIDKTLAVTAIREYIESLGETHNFDIIPVQNEIFIKSITGKIIERDTRKDPGMFSCPHCGFLTKYEEEYQTHIKIHYF
ncbi:MAG: C2H2-type zinc finger protein [Cenarchaeum sp. SB0665_bin_23]|nr:C2H2-type zinc finger protein [Cenarchaeum sp. SB0667_bin_13]MXY37746.1 C2H2-type zinc finger protein [Cenarchaeum sp. SB0664_bin_35]MXY61709.1 C2H2-type zinc finger protein [Cenarchaeum sp. SB0665_bin_23]MXZ93051.1 C2H2-type zinc finger protein [Cenarchaeum sp. SB0666_bin_15]MYB46437.1 C2H2-type zinc finger protein [Cenarchaeum sp. SB0662_bin_33]MYC79146.1 C2H2-type zinc finger protein [Cenarchaeum sp. SB0661_bin_35]MYD58052.1 C2H2-type zinc finger protein [Cenarchaeum sp. SB0678_bin_8]M